VSTSPTPRADSAVWAIINSLPTGAYTSSDSAWHSAFATLKDEFSGRLPGLNRLEFHRSDGVAPVSDDLDEMLPLMDAIQADSSLILNGSSQTMFPDPDLDHEAVLQAAFRLQGLLALPAPGLTPSI
jgi:hypothetical protein